MPILKKIKIEDGIIGLWELSESPDFFKGLIPKDAPDNAIFNRITFEKRKVEFLATRALIKNMLGYYPEIIYRNDGRPLLPKEKYEISISHSRNLAAVILHKHHVGIDVETKGRDIERIAKKFMSDQELKNISEADDYHSMQLLHWCAKEAVFKCTNHEGINFRSQICIDKFHVSEKGEINAVLKKEKDEPMVINYLFIENNALAWCYQE